MRCGQNHSCGDSTETQAHAEAKFDTDSGERANFVAAVTFALL